MRRIRVKSRRVEEKKEIVRPPQDVRTATPNTLAGVYANGGVVPPRSVTDLAESETDISIAVDRNLLTREFMVHTRMYRVPGSNSPLACNLSVPEEEVYLCEESGVIEYVSEEVSRRIADEVRRRVKGRIQQELLRLSFARLRG